MSEIGVTPALGRDRIGELDIIRGFALFGVLWVNMFGYSEYIIPADRLTHLWGPELDRWVGAFTEWVAAGKAQCLFSLLFGFGFAILSERVEARGGNAGALYLRRILILLALGVAHLLLLWAGDILHAYALMGLVLMMTRRWPSWLLLSLGLVLSIAAAGASLMWMSLTTPDGQTPAAFALMEANMPHRWDVYLGRDYFAYVRELLTMAGPEFYAAAIGYGFLGTVLGRFLLGQWIYRRGWMQDTARYAAGFRRALPWLLIGGLMLAAVIPVLELTDATVPKPFRLGVIAIKEISQLVLALGYGCALVVLCQSQVWRGRLAGLGAVGQMALTNYLTQSLVYMFVLNGFGLGWLRYAGPTVCLMIAIAVFGLQIVFSQWWLGRFRFGPAEWLWRSATYGRWQPLRRKGVSTALA